MPDIRAELSKRNKYWLPKHRYYELRHFVLQYPEWKAAINGMDYLKVPHCDVRVNQGPGDPTMTWGELRAYYSSRIDIVDKSFEACDATIRPWIKIGIFQDLAYDKLRARYFEDIHFSRDAYYEEYRKFFWVLNHWRR